jgi:hypothetical protein
MTPDHGPATMACECGHPIAERMEHNRRSTMESATRAVTEAEETAQRETAFTEGWFNDRRSELMHVQGEIDAHRRSLQALELRQAAIVASLGQQPADSPDDQCDPGTLTPTNAGFRVGGLG